MITNLNIKVNNGYKLNAIATFDGSVKEVRFYPDNVVMTSGIAYIASPSNNSSHKYYFKWRDINDNLFTSSSLGVTTKTYDPSSLVDDGYEHDLISSANSDAYINVKLINDCDANSCIMDMNNRFCKVYGLNIISNSKVSIDTYSQEISNVIVTIYDKTFTTTYSNNSVLQPDLYYILVSNGDNTISGGEINLHVAMEVTIIEPFNSATVTSINPDSTHNFTGNISLTSKTYDDMLCSVYKITTDRYCNIKSINSTFSGTATNYGVYLFRYDEKGHVLPIRYNDNLFDTIIDPGTYYIVFYVDDTDKNKCVGNFSFDIVTSGNIQQGSDTLMINSVDSTLCAYNGQLLTSVLTKANSTSTAKLYPHNIDYTETFRFVESGSHKCFVVVTSADGLTKNITNIVEVVTANAVSEDLTIAVSPDTGVTNNSEIAINSDFYVTNAENYMIPGTSKIIVTVTNNTKNTQLGVIDTSVTNVFTITGSTTGDVIQFDAVFVKFDGDTSGASYGTNITLA